MGEVFPSARAAYTLYRIWSIKHRYNYCIYDSGYRHSHCLLMVIWMIHFNRSRNLESFWDVGARSLLSSNNLHKTMDKIFQIWTENRMFFYPIFFNVMINFKKQHSIQVALIVKIVLMCEYLFFLENCMKDSKIFIFFLGKDIKSESHAFYIFIPDQIDFF